jgi:two-component system KDP operon response regulator KdpE
MHGTEPARRDVEQPVILVVEDEPAPMRVLEAGLSARGYRVLKAGTGARALQFADEAQPDVVIVDLGLPDVDGIDLCRRLRQRITSPILVVTADGSEERMVAALDEGADDYVTKPFSMPELLARIRVALRHRMLTFPDDSDITIGTVRVDIAGHVVTVAGEEIELQKRSFDLLTILGRNVGRIVTYGTLARRLWGPEHDEPVVHSLRIAVSRLRKSLGDAPGTPRIVTEAHIGYRLVVDDDTHGDREHHASSR